mmetsp:Transcript_15401/g.61973  ORF Transcript_15401/g.61973 Transcript_15401/m.61973 type:complete len:342 (-) Transcript_15401:423-1448(-)
MAPRTIVTMSPARTIVTLGFALALAAATTEEVTVDAASGAPQSSSTLRVGLEWFLNADHMPLVVAQKQGYFAEQGLAIELVEPADHWEAEAEILAGRLDVAVTETLHLAQDAARQKPILGFAKFLHTDGGVMTFDDAIQRPRDMCAKRIQYPGAPGPGGPAIVQTMVEADGGACYVSSYGKVNEGFDHVGALLAGKADLATLIFANFEIPAAKAAGVAAPRYFSLKEYGVPDFCVLTLFTTPAVFEARRAELRSLVLAMRKAVGFIHREPDRAAAMFLEASPDSPEETVRATLPMFPNDNSISAEYFDHLMSWLVATGQVDGDRANATPPSLYWTNAVALP